MKMAAKQAPAMFGKPITEAQLAGAIPVLLENLNPGHQVRQAQPHWPTVGRRRVQLRQVWVMNQQCGLLLELRDVKLDGALRLACACITCQARPLLAGLQLLRLHEAHAPAAGGRGRHVGLQRRALSLHAGGKRRLHQEGRAVPLTSKTAPAVANAWQQMAQTLSTPTTAPSSKPSSSRDSTTMTSTRW